MVTFVRLFKHIQCVVYIFLFSCTLFSMEPRPASISGLDDEVIKKVAREAAEHALKNQKNQSSVWWFLPPWQILVPVSIAGAGIVCYRYWSVPRQLQMLKKDVTINLDNQISDLSADISKKIDTLAEATGKEKVKAEEQSKTLYQLSTSYAENLKKEKEKSTKMHGSLATLTNEMSTLFTRSLSEHNHLLNGQKNTLSLEIIPIRNLLESIKKGDKDFLSVIEEQSKQNNAQLNQELQTLQTSTDKSSKRLDNLVQQTSLLATQLNSDFQENQQLLISLVKESKDSIQSLQEDNQKVDELLKNDPVGTLLVLWEQASSKETKVIQQHPPVKAIYHSGKPASPLSPTSVEKKKSPLSIENSVSSNNLPQPPGSGFLEQNEKK